MNKSTIKIIYWGYGYGSLKIQPFRGNLRLNLKYIKKDDHRIPKIVYL